MKKITQQEVINEMMGKKISGRTLSEILSARHPEMDASIKTVRTRIESLLHSEYVDIEVISKKGKPNIYNLKSVSDRFYLGCQRQAKRIKKSPAKGRPPFEPHEQRAAMRLQAFTRYLTGVRAM